MVDIQPPTAEIRRGKKKKERNYRMKIYTACPITQGGHKTTGKLKSLIYNFETKNPFYYGHEEVC